MNHFFPSVFTCKTDEDCYGNGYCHARECKCSANYEYAQDCSHHGCKYVKEFGTGPRETCKVQEGT